MSGNPTLLGTVEDVNGATLSVSLNPETLSGLAFIDGIGYRIGQIGSFVLHCVNDATSGAGWPGGT